MIRQVKGHERPVRPRLAVLRPGAGHIVEPDRKVRGRSRCQSGEHAGWLIDRGWSSRRGLGWGDGLERGGQGEAGREDGPRRPADLDEGRIVGDYGRGGLGRFAILPDAVIWRVENGSPTRARRSSQCAIDATHSVPFPGVVRPSASAIVFLSSGEQRPLHPWWNRARTYRAATSPVPPTALDEVTARDQPVAPIRRQAIRGVPMLRAPPRHPPGLIRSRRPVPAPGAHARFKSRGTPRHA